MSDQLKKSANYSDNHKDVGIVFASLVNFNELYDESYMGGKEFLRVLNELISDFDELLDLPEFRNVEKIKTIGATFMAASGLNPFIRKENDHKYQHLKELMEFAFSLQRSVDDFNQSLIEFDLVLRVGLNYGDVTSGVSCVMIKSNKLCLSNIYSRSCFPSSGSCLIMCLGLCLVSFLIFKSVMIKNIFQV